MGEQDPHENYILRCLDSNDRMLPILDKISNKTLSLRNYRVSDGHCKGLAEAFRHLDPKSVSKIILQNCGLTGEQFAVILQGASQLKDLTALIYK